MYNLKSKLRNFGLAGMFLVTSLTGSLGISVIAGSTVGAQTIPVTIAAATDDCKGPQLNKDNCKIIKYIVTLIQVLSAVFGVVVVIMIIVGGIQYSASGDDPQAVSAAKKKIMNALIAVAAYVFGMAFLNYIVPGGVI